MVNIKEICNKLQQELMCEEKQEEVLLSCACRKIYSLYDEQSSQLDDILEELDRSINTNDMNYTYKVIKRLSKHISNNRKQLIVLLEEVNK